jgi:hypothetical protein
VGLAAARGESRERRAAAMARVRAAGMGIMGGAGWV